MLTLEGKVTSSGIALGKLLILASNTETPPMRTVTDREAELARFENALETAKEKLCELCSRTVETAGKEAAAIFEIHSMMLEDEDFTDNIRGMIRLEALGAEYAVYATGKQFSKMFSEMDDEYMRERAQDVLDLAQRLISILTGSEPEDIGSLEEPAVIAARDLLPSQTVQMDKSKVAAFVSEKGSYNSHASILARSLGIPAVSALGEGFKQLQDGQYVIVDGIDGCVVCEPDENTYALYQKKLRDLEAEKARLQKLAGTPACTKDGQRVEICANIGCPEEAQTALSCDAEGIGLFRSEFLYLEGDDFPEEERQFEAYKKALEIMQGRRVVIRTLDLGADKKAPYFKLSGEDNPALGYRAIRICLDRLDIFEPQLRALLRASVYGRLAVMFPMIISLEEVHAIRKMIDYTKEKLREENIPFSPDIEFGIMIETPAAALISDKLAKEVDFFSIGTNDLTQYTLAADRMNPKIGHIFDSGHLALLRMMQTVAENAHKNGIWVGICGESAANPQLTPLYIGMGIDEFSVAPPSILHIKETVQSLVKTDCDALLRETLAYD